MKTTELPGSGLIGLAVLGLCFVGIASSVAAIVAVINDANYIGAGVLAIGAALSFGLLLNSLVRS